MSDSFNGILVPHSNSGLVEAFLSFGVVSPLRMSILEPKLVGIGSYNGVYYQADYERIAQAMSNIAGIAVILRFTDDGSTYKILKRGHATIEYSNESVGLVLETLDVGLDEIEIVLNGWSEIVFSNFPSMETAVRNHVPFLKSHATSQSRARLLKLAETVDRLLDSGNQEAAKSILNQLLIESSGPGLRAVQAIFEAKLQSFDT